MSKAKLQIGKSIREVEILWEGEKRGKPVIVYREYLPNGKLGEMEHSTSPHDIVSRE